MTPPDIASMTIAELGAYVVGRPWWRWMPGMVTSKGARLLHSHGGTAVYSRGKVRYWTDYTAGMARPDLDDPATVGCLLGIADELAGAPVRLDIDRFIDARATHLDYDVRGTPRIVEAGYGPTRAIALVALCDALHAGGAQ